MYDIQFLAKELNQSQMYSINKLAKDDGVKCCYNSKGPDANFKNDFMTINHTVAYRQIMYATNGIFNASKMVGFSDFVFRDAPNRVQLERTIIANTEYAS